MLAVQAAAASLTDPTPLTDYKEPQYWLTYDGGFVRRGLPGDVLAWLAGGPPSREVVAAAGIALTAAAVLAVVALALGLARRARQPLAAATVVITSPLTASLLLHDVGRYDGVAVVVLSALAVVPGWSRLPLPVTVGLVAAAVAVATATQELLVAVVAPVAVTRVLLAARHRDPPARTVLAAVALVPGLALAAASALLAPSPAVLERARRDADAAGAPDPGGWGDALDAASRSLTENLTFFTYFSPAALAWTLALWAGLFIGTGALLPGLLGQTSDRRWWWPLVGYSAAYALALSALGVDFRRWWGLALLGLVAVAATSSERPGHSPPGRPPPVAVRPAALAALFGAGLAAQGLPVFPVPPPGT